MSRFSEVKKYLEVEAALKYATEKAYQLSYQDDTDTIRTEWFPKSAVQNRDEIDERNKNDTQIFHIAEWVCKDKGVPQ